MEKDVQRNYGKKDAKLLKFLFVQLHSGQMRFFGLFHLIFFVFKLLFCVFFGFFLVAVVVVCRFQ